MKKFHSLVLSALLIGAVVTSCSDSGEPAEAKVDVTVSNTLPDDFTGAAVSSASMTFTELNTRQSSTFTFDGADAVWEIDLAPGLYDYTGEINYITTLPDGSEKAWRLRAVGNSVNVVRSTAITPSWFKASLSSEGLIISEIYATGSPKADGKSGLRDAYIRIYNNSSETLYADGLGFVESDFTNSTASDYQILTPANDRSVNFTVGAVWVIPGNGQDVPIAPGEYITIADQAIDWSEQVSGALDLTGADFEWYDNHAMDTDNPAVANLDKWFSYSATIWIMNNQCLKSYALVRFPQGTTAESYLAGYKGEYDYISTTGSQMHKSKAYLIPNGWIIDGVNLSNSEQFVRGALAPSIDSSYASVSDKKSDPNRFGRKFVRKTSYTAPDGRVVLQDTDDSAADFQLVSVK